MVTLATRKPETNGRSLADRMYNDLLTDFPFTTFLPMAPALRSLVDTASRPGAYLPQMDVSEKDDTYTVKMALPGYRDEDLEVEASGNRLSIRGTLAEEAVDERTSYHIREIRRGSFQRSVAFDEDIDPESVAASFKDGVLTVSLKAARPVSAKKIAISKN